MSLGDDIAAALPELRALAESRMVDACRVTRAGDGEPVFDENSGTYTPADPVTVYAGPCEVQLVDVLPQSAVAGEADVVTQRAIVKLPVASSAGVLLHDRVEVTSATLDPDLLGRVYTVTGLHHKTFATARRLQCEEVT